MQKRSLSFLRLTVKAITTAAGDMLRLLLYDLKIMIRINKIVRVESVFSPFLLKSACMRATRCERDLFLFSLSLFIFERERARTNAWHISVFFMYIP